MEDKLLISVLNKKETDRVPFWFMRQAGRYLPEYRAMRANFPSFLDMCYTPEAAAEVTLQPIRRFDMDAAIVFSDILVIPHALGMKVWFEEGEGPKLDPIRNANDAQRLDVSRVKNHLAPVFETLSRVRKALSPEKTLIGFCGSPWTVASYMVRGAGGKDFSVAVQFARENEKIFSHIIDVLVESSIEYLSEKIKSGADCVQLFDSWAGELQGDDFDKWVIEPTKKLVDGFKKRNPGVPVIGFPRMSGDKVARYVKGTGVDAVSLDSSLTLEKARDEIQPLCVVQGCLDNIALCEDINAARAQTQSILDAFSQKPFVFNLAHGMIPATPVAHVQAISEMVKGHRRR